MSVWKVKWWVMALTLVALGFHLWRLDQPPRLMSDEWYFVQDGQKYFSHQRYLDAHPPLGKLQLAAVFSVVGSRPFTWRLLNAVEGALLIPVLAWVAWLLTHRPRAAAIAAWLVFIDGFVLTESRSGLINIPYILYAFVGVACVISALHAFRPRRWLMGAGIFIGLAVSVKWLALLIVLPAAVLWWWPQWFGMKRQNRVGLGESLIWLGVLPAAMYWAVWAIHFAWLGIPQRTVATNLSLIKYHLDLPPEHPYREEWWRWLLLWQPFPYWSAKINGVLQMVWSMGNPFVWWTGIGAITIGFRRLRFSPERLVMIFLLSSWLPFALIQRDMFLYHAIPFGLWLFVLIAIILDHWWERSRVAVLSYFIVATAVFAWFLPWYLNIPLSPQQHRLREWLPEWHLKTNELRYLRSFNTTRAPSTVPASLMKARISSLVAPVRSAHSSAAPIT